MKILTSIDATPEMRDGKPYCPGCDGGCTHCTDEPMCPSAGKPSDDLQESESSAHVPEVTFLCPKLRGNRGTFVCFSCWRASSNEYEHVTHRCRS